MNFKLIDDGTLDTVLQCDECGHYERYTFAAWADDAEDANDYGAFTDWAIDDARTVHICQDDSSTIQR